MRAGIGMRCFVRELCDLSGAPPRPEIGAPDETQRWLARGDWLVERRPEHRVLSQLDQMYGIIPVLMRNRERVAQHGHCGRGCSEECIEPDGMGRPVCFRTRDACPGLIRLLFQTLGESRNELADETIRRVNHPGHSRQA